MPVINSNLCLTIRFFHVVVTLYNDCVHWCVPVPIDVWNEMLLPDVAAGLIHVCFSPNLFTTKLDNDDMSWSP